MPTALAELLKSMRWYKADNDPQLHPCEGSKFHSPRPLKVFPYRLGSGKTIWLCGTCKDNAQLYVGLQDFFKGTLAWDIQRSFGNELRKIGNTILKNSFSGN